MLTIYIIPCDDPSRSDFGRAEESFSEVASRVIQLDHRKLNEIKDHKNPYFGFIFSDEWIDEGLQEALPFYLAQKKPDFDYLVLYKKVFENVGGIQGTPKIFISPRIFRQGIVLEGKASLVPENPTAYKHMTVMDGWILEPERMIQ
jgi:hypothetical protein